MLAPAGRTTHQTIYFACFLEEMGQETVKQNLFKIEIISFWCQRTGATLFHNSLLVITLKVIEKISHS